MDMNIIVTRSLITILPCIPKLSIIVKVTNNLFTLDIY
jgi:hypothetical protein